MMNLTEPIQIETGLIVGEQRENVRIFKGIPYAAPPVGELRWREPQSAAIWDSVRECTKYSPQAAQAKLGVVDTTSNEDCLYLNIITPVKSVDEKFPVMVWFHGGGLTNGTGNNDMLLSEPMTQKGVVLVTVNHRLGLFGFFAHPELAAESEYGVSGNQAYLDLIASLQWIQRNIQAFGGDAGNVTIFGESGGGGKVHAMLVTPLAKGLFHRAIIESGTAPSKGGKGNNASTSRVDAEEQGREIFARLGVKTLAEARALPWEEILHRNAPSRLPPKKSDFRVMPIGWTIDGRVFPEAPEVILDEARHTAVPVIVGANQGELYALGRIARQIPFYEALLNANASANVPAYAYLFNQVPAGWAAKGIPDMGHATEIPYVFGAVEDGAYMAQMGANLGGGIYWVKGPSPEDGDPGLTDADQKVSDAMMTMWAQFARTGNPNSPVSFHWPIWSREQDEYLFIAENMEQRTKYKKLAKFPLTPPMILRIVKSSAQKRKNM